MSFGIDHRKHIYTCKHNLHLYICSIAPTHRLTHYTIVVHWQTNIGLFALWGSPDLYIQLYLWMWCSKIFLGMAECVGCEGWSNIEHTINYSWSQLLIYMANLHYTITHNISFCVHISNKPTLLEYNRASTYPLRGKHPSRLLILVYRRAFQFKYWHIVGPLNLSIHIFSY